MQIETLSHLKQQIISLDPDSKKQLAAFLADELHEEPEKSMPLTTDEDRRWQTEWLRVNREQYADRYVALYGSKFVAEGPTLAATQKKADDLGFPGAFITYVFSENEEVFGGW